MAKINTKTLGEIIKEAMKERGIKGSVVARKMNVSRQTINQIDLRKKFDIEFLQNFKEASGLDFTHYALDDIIAQVPRQQRVKYLNKQSTITINISIVANKENIENLPLFIKQIEELGKRLGFELI